MSSFTLPENFKDNSTQIALKISQIENIELIEGASFGAKLARSSTPLIYPLRHDIPFDILESFNVGNRLFTINLSRYPNPDGTYTITYTPV